VNFTAIHDTATVSGGITPYASTATVTFKLYNNPTGSGTPLFTSANVPLVNGSATSASFTPTAVGTVYWVATFNGDANNPIERSGLAAEPVTVLAAPVVSTQQSATTVVVNMPIHDTATVTGGITPYASTATVTFNLYNNSTGSGTPLFTNTQTLVNGIATSASFTPTALGTFYWVATFNGDTNNPIESSGLAAEPVTVVATPVLPPIISKRSLLASGL
jgi:hypothetical protein